MGGSTCPKFKVDSFDNHSVGTFCLKVEKQIGVASFLTDIKCTKTLLILKWKMLY